ncbi:MAG: LysR family transcriptional regulator, partial [Paracoccaceae bacterium]
MVGRFRLTQRDDGGIVFHGVSLLWRFWQAQHQPRYAAFSNPSSPSFGHSSRTQQGTSSSIARLREIFDDQLFVRHGHGVEPTPKAEQIYPSVTKALKSLETLVDAGSFDPKTVRR